MFYVVRIYIMWTPNLSVICKIMLPPCEMFSVFSYDLQYVLISLGTKWYCQKASSFHHYGHSTLISEISTSYAMLFFKSHIMSFYKILLCNPSYNVWKDTLNLLQTGLKLGYHTKSTLRIQKCQKCMFKEFCNTCTHIFA